MEAEQLELFEIVEHDLGEKEIWQEIDQEAKRKAVEIPGKLISKLMFTMKGGATHE